MMIVVDANVFNKLFLAEPDQDQAKAFFREAVNQNVSLVAPTLFRYEAWEVARRNSVPLSEVSRMITLQQNLLLELVEPTLEHVLKAEEIASHGTKNSGFPSIYDSIYHAIALVEGGMFLTADHKHAAKVQKFGALVELENWQDLFLN